MKTKRILIPIIISLIIFIVIIIMLLNGKISNFDNNFYNLLMIVESDLLTNYFKIITKLADVITIVILLILSLVFFYKKKESFYLLITIIISTIINFLLKYIFSRPRPVNINKIIETGYSFPSGHAMASVTFYGFLIYLIIKSKLSLKIKWITSILLTLIIFSICISRVYLGVHYISDVLAGVFLSTSLLLSVILYIKRLEEKNEKSFNNWSK